MPMPISMLIVVEEFIFMFMSVVVEAIVKFLFCTEVPKDFLKIIIYIYIAKQRIFEQFQYHHRQQIHHLILAKIRSNFSILFIFISKSFFFYRQKI